MSGYLQLRSVAYFGIITYVDKAGNRKVHKVTKNYALEGYKTEKLCIAATKKYAAYLENSGHVIENCTLLHSPTVIVYDHSNTYPLKP